ncbi:MAG TPA: hypothetical protein VK973_18220, partial [Arenicellales bacterium]|nr:hypothetical protein [Arenicellales bacterium]
MHRTERYHAANTTERARTSAAPYLLAASLLAGASLLPQPAVGGAWTRAQGDSLLSVPVTYTTADEGFDQDGEREDRLEFEMFEIAPYFEYGLLDSLTFGMQPKYRDVEVETSTGDRVSNSGPAESDFFLRKRLWHSGDAAFSTQGLVKAPIDPEEDHAAALGRDQVDL